MNFGKELLCLMLLYHTGAALELIVPPTHQARVGSNTRIPCKYKVEKLPVDVRFFAIYWYKERKNILSYDNIVTKADTKYSFDMDVALHGIADLSISNISLFDVGVYICSVIYSPLKVEKEIQLDIKTHPQIVITGKVILINKYSVLRSSITGFYPEDIDIKWFSDGEILDMVTVDRLQRNPDGTFSVNSSVIITPTEEDRERIFSCRVQHQSLNGPLHEDFQLVYGAPPQIVITNKVIDANKESVLRSSITGFYPEDIDIKWFRDGEILNRVTVDKTLRHQVGTFSVNSAVMITPTEEDRERIFSCRVQHQSLNGPLQEDFQLIYGASPVILIPNKDVSINKENTLHCKVTGFLSPDIVIHWLVDEAVVQNQFVGKPQQDKDGTYWVNSTMKITPTDEHRNKTFSCRVQHASLQEPLQEDFKLLYKGINGNEAPGVTMEEISSLQQGNVEASNSVADWIIQVEEEEDEIINL